MIHSVLLRVKCLLKVFRKDTTSLMHFQIELRKKYCNPMTPHSSCIYHIPHLTGLYMPFPKILKSIKIHTQSDGILFVMPDMIKCWSSVYSEIVIIILLNDSFLIVGKIILPQNGMREQWQYMPQ